MFGSLKKDIDLSNKKRAKALREREDFRKRCEEAEAGATKALEESLALKKQVGATAVASAMAVLFDMSFVTCALWS